MNRTKGSRIKGVKGSSDSKIKNQRSKYNIKEILSK
jgi:hypothetical protein